MKFYTHLEVSKIKGQILKISSDNEKYKIKKYS